MKITVLRTRIVVVLFALLLFLSAEVFISMNWVPDHLTKGYLFEVGRRFYTERLESYLLPNADKINPHIVFGILMLVTGGLQFSSRLRAKRPRLHRTLGYAYFLTGFIGISVGLLIAHKTLGGIHTQVSNYFTGTLWMISAGYALRMAVRKDFVSHEHWVFRSYVMAASVGIMRIFFILFDTLKPGLGLDVLFQLSNWVALVIALIIWAIVPYVPSRRKKD